jgi:arylsulfatase A-like enzyme
MSGKYPARYGIPGFQDYSRGPHAIPIEDDTIGDRLKAEGYDTAYIGKWHVGKRNGGEPNYQGFDYVKFAGEPGQPVSFFSPYHIDRGKWQQPKENIDYTPFTNESLGPKGEFLTERLTDEAIKFIEKKRTKPFFMTLAYYGVHIPTEAPQRLIKKHQKRRKQLKIAKGDSRYEVKIISDSTGEYKSVQNHVPYAAQVETIDESVGRLVSTLHQLGLEDNTLIVFTSDHGGFSSRSTQYGGHLPAVNLPYRHGKGWLYDGGLRVPHIVKWPAKINAGGKIKYQTSGVDHHATFLEASGVEKYNFIDLDTVSYLKAVNGEEHTRGPIFWHSPLPRPTSMGDTAASAVIAANYKLIKWQDLGNYELYDLESDPGEQMDLSHSNPEKLLEMKSLLDSCMMTNELKYK